MSIASNLWSPTDRRQSTASENFRPFSISLCPPSETSLQRPRQSFFSTANDVATAISPSGWVAAASTRHVHLYNMNTNRSQTIPPKAALVVKMISKHEEIRAVAISEDLLAVVTHSRLLVYDGYKTSNAGDLASSLVEEGKRIDQNGNWTPRSVSIAQVGTAATGVGATACIVVGGEGENGVKVYRYTYGNCWNTTSDRLILKCPGNNGAVKLVGFSPFQRKSMYGPMAFALTTGNRLYCWELYSSPPIGMQSIPPIWHLNCNPTINQRSYRDEISSAALIMSPTCRPYFLCTVDHKQGSHVPPTFIVPIDLFEKNPHILLERIKPIPESVLGANILAGAASSNGHFLVLLEKGRRKNLLKVLTLQGAPRGGLTSTAPPLAWETRLEGISLDASTISISIEETRGALEVIAVDGCGHAAFARISVPGMLVSRNDEFLARPSTIELAYNVPAPQELPS